jgi:aspartate aminotransferase
MTAEGIDVVNLSIGEPDFDTPAHIKEAAKAAIDQNYSKYPPVAGYLSLRKAISAKLLRENGLQYSPEEIIVSNGAKQSLCNAVLSLVSPGEEVIIPAPYWVSYPQMVRLAGGVPVYVNAPIGQHFKMTSEQLEAAITPRTRLVILCSPSNPSGAVYSRGELEALAEVILRHKDLFVVTDEIYEHINYVGGHASIASVPGMRERAVLVNGVSKAYAMPGWRIGYLAAPRWIVGACSRLQGQYTSGAGTISQKAAEAALSGPQDCVEKMRLAFLRRRNLLVGLLREIPGLEVNEPEGAFYLFPRCAGFFGKANGGKVIHDASEMAMYLLEEGHVATVSGDGFGAPGYLRLSYATSDENLVEAARRMKEALGKLTD